MFPHLSRIAQKYRDRGLKVIGLSLDDASPGLQQFVHSQGDKMDYTVSLMLPLTAPQTMPCLRSSEPQGRMAWPHNVMEVSTRCAWDTGHERRMRCPDRQGHHHN